MLQEIATDKEVSFSVSEYLRLLLKFSLMLQKHDLTDPAVLVSRDIAMDFYQFGLLLGALPDFMEKLCRETQEMKADERVSIVGADELMDRFVQLFYDEFDQSETLEFEKLFKHTFTYENILKFRMDFLGHDVGQLLYAETSLLFPWRVLSGSHQAATESPEEYKARCVGDDYSPRVKRWSKEARVTVRVHSDSKITQALNLEHVILSLAVFREKNNRDESYRFERNLKRTPSVRFKNYLFQFVCAREMLEWAVADRRKNKSVPAMEVAQYADLLFGREVEFLNSFSKVGKPNTLAFSTSIDHVIALLDLLRETGVQLSPQRLSFVQKTYADNFEPHLYALLTELEDKVRECPTLEGLEKLKTKIENLSEMTQSAFCLFNALDQYTPDENIHLHLSQLSAYLKKLEDMYFCIVEMDPPVAKTAAESDEFQTQYLSLLRLVRQEICKVKKQHDAFSSLHGLPAVDWRLFAGRNAELLALELSRMNAFRLSTKGEEKERVYTSEAQNKWLLSLVRFTSADMLKHHFVLSVCGLLPLVQAYQNGCAVCFVFCALFWCSTAGIQLLRGVMLFVARELERISNFLQAESMPLLASLFGLPSLLIQYLFNPTAMINLNTRLVPGMSRHKQISLAVMSFMFSAALIMLCAWLLLPYILPAISVLAPICFLAIKFKLTCEFTAFLSAAFLFLAGQLFLSKKILPKIEGQKKRKMLSDFKDQYPGLFCVKNEKAQEVTGSAVIRPMAID